MKIAVLGIGGIGGLVGGVLAKKNKDVYFIARGENLKAIRQKGLHVKSDRLGSFTVKGELATDNPSEVGIVDVLFIATKSYSLESACIQCKPMIGENTVVIPLLNGVSAAEEIEQYVKDGQFAEGCIYGFSSLEGPGKVRHIGELCNVDFGFADGRDNEKCVKISEMLNAGGIQTNFRKDIMTSIWTKYIMMCGNSCVFSYFECSADEVHKDPVKMQFIEDVYRELFQLAKAKGVILAPNLVENHLEVFKRLPKGAITSLYRDLQNPENSTEFEAIIGKGYRLAKEVGLEVPCLSKAYHKNEGR